MQNGTNKNGLRMAAAAVALVAASALVFHIGSTLSRYPDRALLPELWRHGRYFTILTVLLIALAFARIAVTGRVGAAWVAGLTYWTAIVGLVYHTLLARDLTGMHWWSDQGLHTAVPLAVIAWWLIYAPKTGLTARHAVYWLSWPGLYMAYALIRGEIDGRHPYFFIDPPLIGWPRVGVWIVGLGVAFWLGGLAIVAVTRRISPAPLLPAGGGPDDPPPPPPRGPGRTRAGG